MKKKIFNSKQDAFYFILGLITIAIGIYFSIKLLDILIEGIKTVFDKYTTISVALITGFLAFLSAPVGKFFENRYSINNEIRKEKQIVYIDFLNWLINQMLNNEISKNKNILSEIKENQKNITIFGSDKVLKSWLEFKKIAFISNDKKVGLTTEEKTVYYAQNEAPYLEKLILCIRKDLGYKNRNIKKNDILRLYINDIDEYL